MGDMGGMGRIYWRAINGYAARHGIAGDAFDDFVTFIRALDDEFLQHMRDKRPAPDAAPVPSTQSERSRSRERGSKASTP